MHAHTKTKAKQSNTVVTDNFMKLQMQETCTILNMAHHVTDIIRFKKMWFMMNELSEGSRKMHAFLAHKEHTITNAGRLFNHLVYAGE